MGGLIFPWGKQPFLLCTEWSPLPQQAKHPMTGAYLTTRQSFFFFPPTQKLGFSLSAACFSSICGTVLCAEAESRLCIQMLASKKGFWLLFFNSNQRSSSPVLLQSRWGKPLCSPGKGQGSPHPALRVLVPACIPWEQGAWKLLPGVC